MVVWLADLSDFSRLTYQITERERGGPEVVTELLSGTFGTIIETISHHGGEVLGFAGDSVLATWLIDERRTRNEAVTLAGWCGLEVHELKLPEVYARPPLQLRIGIGIGQGVLMQVGGVEGRWHFVIGGRPFDQTGQAAAKAGPGEVVLSSEAYEAIGPRAGGQVHEEGFFKLRGVDEAPASPPSSLPRVTDDLNDEIRSYLSQPVVARIDAVQSEWIAEFRRVTSVFIGLPSLDTSTAIARDTLQDVVRTAQRSLDLYEGTLAQILVDDKGVTIMAAFGLPPYAHEEDPYRAVQASEDIQQALRQMRLDYGIGIATGRAYCGTYGSSIRRDYTTIGREVNLAARLMRAARFEILCDEATARAARWIEFHPLEPRPVHGWDRPIEVFRPLWERVLPEVDGRTPEAVPLHLVGRDSERNQLIDWLGALEKVRSSSVVVVEGEAGMGKSAMAADLVRTAQSSNVQTLVGAALPVAQAPYHVWREVISDLLGLTGVRSVERRQDIVRERLQEWPQFIEWQGLLNPVLDLQLPETDSTRGMSGRNRRASTVELLVTLLGQAATKSPLLIVLDDLHWFDSASWAVLLEVARKVSPLLLVLVSRPMLEPPEEIRELAAIGTSARLVLSPLSPQSALELAKSRLGAVELDPAVANVIIESAEGIPFFIEELVYSLRDANALTLEDGVVTLARSLEELDVPHSLSSIVLSRIDRLSPQLQLTLKVASVIGSSFDLEALGAVHPSLPGADELATEIEQLTRLELIVESSPGSYDFKHTLIHDAAYELLLFDQRRRIHQNVGSFIESLGDDQHETPNALLAYHWDRGGDHQKAITYLEKTGASSVRRGANREAIAAHSRSLELFDQDPEAFPEVTPLRRSQWHLEIGQAYEALGKFDVAERSLYRALDLVGVHLSAKSLRRVGRLVWEAAKQALHIALPGAIRVPHAEEERARLAQGSRVAAVIGEIYYFTGNLLGFPVLNLVAINLGEKAGEPLVAGIAYSSFGWLAGTMRMRRLAERYFRLARIAEELEDGEDLAGTPYAISLEETGPGHLIAVALAESVLALTFNEWNRAREVVTEGLDRCNRLGDTYSAGIALAIRGFGSYSSGRLEEALDDYNRLLASSRERRNPEHEGWATSFATPVLLAFNRVAEAEAMAAAAIAILDQVDPLTVPVIHGTLAQVQLRAGRPDEARSSAELALAAIDSTPIFIYLAGFNGLLDTLLQLWESEGAPASPEAKDLVKRTRKGLKTMGNFARVLPFARPRYLLFKGRMEHLQHKTPEAQRTFRKGLELAGRSGFAWDHGLLQLELARTFPTGSTDRHSHLASARELFEEVGSIYDLERSDSLSS